MDSKHIREVQRHVANQHYAVVDGALILPKMKAMLRGTYFHDVNGEDYREDPNIITDEGWIHILNVAFRNQTRYATWYLALYGANYTPLASLTAASFPATASEITSGTEGYSNATRPVWTPAAPTTPLIDNTASRAQFTIVTASTLAVNGAALVSEQTKGATTGVLPSATKFDTTRTLNNGDVFNLGYRMQLTST